MVKFDQLLYGGDYNPEQWLEYPEILEKDLEYMRLAKINTVSVGIFSWAMLEPEEGVFRFEWLEEIVDRLYENGVSVILATPSGARPKWLADKYPEVLRVDESGHRNFFGGRHNHCYTSPVYREKVKIINQELARRLGNHPAVRLWHISNEYGGACYCPLCQEEFRRWLREKYGTIEELNRRWCTAFWSHRYNDFAQIEAPSQRGERELHALKLDWKRFVTARTTDFMRYEISCLREAGSKKPATTNMMYHFGGLNYAEMAKYVDVVSWDTYPTWHKEKEHVTALDCGMQHDIMRSLKKQPFLLMESCPSSTNWQSVSKLKKPGMLQAQSLQAIAHGSDSVLYFQFRQSQGASEKFHGAVVDHYGGSDTRVFREAAKTGASLEVLRELCGTEVHAEAAVLYDWENRWAMEDAQGPRNRGLFYKETLEKSYRALRRLGLNVDVIDMGKELDGYRLVAVPMMYLFKDGFAEKLRSFTAQGGTVLMTYWSGIVDETDRCFLGGTPHGLMDVFGLRSAEIDGLYDWESNTAVPTECGQGILKQIHTCRALCELVEVKGAKSVLTLGEEDCDAETEKGSEKASGSEKEMVMKCGESGHEKKTGKKCGESGDEEKSVDGHEKSDSGAEVLAVYGSDFYEGTPALTRNVYGKGTAYYICADFEQSFYDEVFDYAVKEARISIPPLAEIPQGVEVMQRDSGEASYLMIQNFSETEQEIIVTDPEYDVMFGKDPKRLKKYETVVFRKSAAGKKE
ncbi:MAG: beta-galactosidase [Lachnospiraceae bacterium]|nr:beta-galactosidase [Lachnospiraceae bacterium]